MLSDELGAMYARLPGDAWNLGGGFAVLRARRPLGGPMGFLTTADDKDKANVPWPLLAGVVLLAGALGIVFTLLEHTSPLRELVRQAERLKAGGIDGLQVSAFRGSYRLVAQNLNLGMERSIEKAGGVTRKPADLESILGPTPAQPAMSAFSFPLAEAGSNPAVVPPVPPPSGPVLTPVPGPAGPPRPAAGSSPRPPGMSPASPGPALSALAVQAPHPAAPAPLPAAGRPAPPPRPAVAAAPFPSPPPPVSPPRAPMPSSRDEDDDATMVGAVPAELMAQATGESPAGGEPAEWLSVFDDFIRTKKQCGEPTDGLTFEKFAQTLKKNRDALIQRHGCKRVKFTVYTKDGRASLKATPVKE
jgi:hypothetical protein